LNSSQEYEGKYLADKLGVSVQAITGAKRATKSTGAKTLKLISTVKRSKLARKKKSPSK